MFAYVIEVVYACGGRGDGLSGHWIAQAKSEKRQCEVFASTRGFWGGKIQVLFTACHQLAATCHFCSKGALGTGSLRLSERSKWLLHTQLPAIVPVFYA